MNFTHFEIGPDTKLANLNQIMEIYQSKQINFVLKYQIPSQDINISYQNTRDLINRIIIALLIVFVSMVSEEKISM